MKSAFFAILLSATLCGCKQADHPSLKPPEPVPTLRQETDLAATPFSQVVVESGRLKLQTKGNWSSNDRLIRDSDFLYLEPNKQIELYERHTSLQLIYIPPSDLVIYSRFYSSFAGKADTAEVILFSVKE